MARPRQFAESLTHHVMARGNNKRVLFDDDRDRCRFLRLLRTQAHRRRWTCFAYCLMGNHVHLVLLTPRLDLADGMRDLLSQYARTYNRRVGRSGHLFSERYRAVAIADDRQLMAAIRYVARNPVSAGLVDDPRDWPWSSYSALLRGGPEAGTVATAAVLPLFAASNQQALRHMYAFVTDGIAPPTATRASRGVSTQRAPAGSVRGV